MNLPAFGVKRPTTNLMIFLAILVLALYSITRLGVDQMPEIEPPSITVVTLYPGASPEDVETKVTEVLENQLATTPGLEKITSRSVEGVSVLTLKFIWGTNMDEASNDIRDRIDRSKRFLPDIPDEIDEPFIFKFNTAMIPILFVGVTGEESYPELFDMIDKRVCDPLRQIPGVGTVQLNGGLERQINIWVDRPRLEGYGYSILDLMNVIKAENITQPAGSLKSGLTDYLLRVPGEFKTPEEINTVILGKLEGTVVYLKDVATVEDGFKEVLEVIRINRKPGLMMIIQKQTGTNTVEVATRAKKRIAELAPTLPPDVDINIVMDTSQDIIDSLSSLRSTVWAGGMFVIIVVWFFLRQPRPSLIIALTIPFSLLMSFIYLFTSGKTINVISLSALTIAIGMVVDNAIVVVDNVHRHLEKGQRPQEAAVFGTSEMFMAIAASTLTTVVVFLPMMFISGVVGIMFGELAVIIIVTLMGSLFTAVTFSPMLCSKWMERGAPPVYCRAEDGCALKPWTMPWIRDRQAMFFSRFYALSEKWFTSWEAAYAKALEWCLGHRRTVILGFLSVFIFSLFLTRFVGNEFAPEEDTGDIRVTVNLAMGTRVEESDKVARMIENIIQKDIPEVKFAYVRSGQARSGMSAIFNRASGSHVIYTGIKLSRKTERKRSVNEVAQLLRKKILEIPGVVKLDVTPGNPIGRMITGMGGKSIQVEVAGNSFEETNAVAAKIKEIMNNIRGAVDASVSRDMDRPEININVDREKASVLGLNMKTIADSVKVYMEGQTATKYREKGETYDIHVRLDEASRANPEDIEQLVLVSPFTGERLRRFTGNPVKLGNIATLTEVLGPVEIERKNRERVVYVECNTYRRSMGKVIEDIKRKIGEMALPPDVTINFGGEAEEQGKAFKDLTLLLVLGISLVYMVMAAQFESLLDPLIVMFAIPFTFTGVILAFVITGTTLSIISFLGIVMLMGIVVNNAIVLISYINILRARGNALLQAVTGAGRHRLRPVLMTTITTLAGLLPLAFSRGEGSESWQPLGITMIGGLAVSALVTMLFVPTMYAVFEQRLKGKKG